MEIPILSEEMMGRHLISWSDGKRTRSYRMVINAEFIPMILSHI